MPRARLRERLLGAAGRRVHLLAPAPGGPLAVAHEDRDRRAQRAPVPDPAEELDLVLLEAHPRAAPVPEPPPGQFAGDVLEQDRESGREPFDGDHQGGTVRLPRGQEAEHPKRIGEGLPAPVRLPLPRRRPAPQVFQLL